MVGITMETNGVECSVVQYDAAHTATERRRSILDKHKPRLS